MENNPIAENVKSLELGEEIENLLQSTNDKLLYSKAFGILDYYFKKETYKDDPKVIVYQ
jgi:hypothetical protein